MFSFNAKNFFGKKKASIKVESGDWSDKFSLDVAGSSGVINCKSDGVIYNVSLTADDLKSFKSNKYFSIKYFF